MTTLFLDFETRCALDLKKVGVYNYAAQAEILCTGWAVDDGPVRCEAGFSIEVMLEASKADVLVAHNAGFERLVLRARGVPTPWECWHDTAAMAARMALPRKLEHLAQALHLDAQKDMAGHRVMLRLSKPKKGYDKDVSPDEDEFWEEEDRPEDFAALRQYCADDVEVMRAAYRRLLPLEPTEAALYALTGRMNDRGVAVDLGAIPPALALLEREQTAGEARFRVLSGGPGLRSYARAAPALGLPNMKKPTVRRALRDVSILPHQKEALTIFTRLARSSPAKLTALQRRTSPEGRLRGSLIYAGAERTTRWSSGGVQLQNIPKGMGEAADTAFEALAAGALDLLYDDTVGTVADMLRGYFIEAPGLLVGDFAQIEARALAWLAGQHDVVQAFAKGEDLYCRMASRIYGREITKKDKPERTMGKVVVLGAGYGIGWEKFQTYLSDVWDIDVDEAFAMRVIGTYREANHRIAAWWRRLDDAFKFTVRHQKDRVQVDARVSMGTTEVGGLRYAWIQLPGGRRLWYAEPAMTDKGVEYWGRNIYKGGKWDRVGTWGGKLAENITQATARDVMADAMLRLDAAGFGLLLTVHDEVVAVDNGDVAGYKSILMTPPGWASGLPIDVEIFQSRRYRK